MTSRGPFQPQIFYDSMIISPRLGPSQLSRHQAGSRGALVLRTGGMRDAALLHPALRFTALSSLPGSCGAAAVVPFGWENGSSPAVWAAALEELHPAGRLVPRSWGAAPSPLNVGASELAQGPDSPANLHCGPRASPGGKQICLCI